MRAALLLVVALSGCAKNPDPVPDYPVTDDLLVVDPDELGVDLGPTVPPAGGGEAPAPNAPPRVVAAEHTPIEGPAPTVRIAAPTEGQVVRRAMLRIAVRNWPLAPDPGNHVHVIVDDEPYIAVRAVAGPIDLAALVQENLGHPLAPGTHVVRVFPSRAHHESVKQPGAFASVLFHYQQRTEGMTFDHAAPLLTYSRPKGCYPAGERILLDFYLTNAGELAAGGNRVHYSIDGDVEGYFTAWTPYYIENLGEGEHTLGLQLVDGDGTVIAGPFNDSTHGFRVGGCEGS